MHIDGRTKIIGVMGWPVEHTLSPAMQNAALEEMGINWVYVPMSVNPDDLSDVVAGLRAIHSPGWNLTIPHKLNILPLLDVVTPEAKAVGAVNTVVRRDDLLIGYNTDIAGFLRSAEKEGFKPSGGEPVMVAGSGGVARAITYALSHAGCDLTVVSRNLQKTAQMCAEIEITANVIEYHDEQVPSIMQRSQLLVNATSLGMGAQADCSLPLPLELLNKSALVFDTVYSPAETRLMNQARQLGHHACNGLGMLLMQGAAALELWTQRDVPIESMNNAIQQAFQSR